jgi:RNA polymerase sigma-70 factor (ECF subfamily)
LSEVKAVLIPVIYQAAVGPENQKKPLPGEATQTPAAKGSLNAAIAAEMPRLRRHAVSLLYNTADAEDLIQDCLETALAKQATLKDPTRLRPWMLAILNNLFLMRLRSGSRRGAIGSTEDFADSLAAAAPAEDRAATLDLARAMGRLSMEHRQILLLINLEGHSYDDVAEILAIPRGTVMSRLARARERLRALLEGRDLRTVES